MKQLPVRLEKRVQVRKRPVLRCEMCTKQIRSLGGWCPMSQTCSGPAQVSWPRTGEPSGSRVTPGGEGPLTLQDTGFPRGLRLHRPRGGNRTQRRTGCVELGGSLGLGLPAVGPGLGESASGDEGGRVRSGGFARMQRLRGPRRRRTSRRGSTVPPPGPSDASFNAVCLYASSHLLCWGMCQ